MCPEIYKYAYIHPWWKWWQYSAFVSADCDGTFSKPKNDLFDLPVKYGKKKIYVSKEYKSFFLHFMLVWKVYQKFDFFYKTW